MHRARLLQFECPVCGKSVKAGWSSRTVDPLALLTARHKDREGRPCQQVEVPAP